MNKAIFLDRDGTINVDYGYVYKIDDFKFIDGVIPALKKFKENGYLLIVVTNQSGIARGMYQEKDFLKLNQYMEEKLLENGIKIDGVYWCPHLENCECRKPKTSLFYKAKEDFNIDFSKSYVIGDKLRDLALASEVSVKAILINKDFDLIAKKNLYDAATYICGGEFNE